MLTQLAAALVISSVTPTAPYPSLASQDVYAAIPRSYELQVPPGYDPDAIIIDSVLPNGWITGALILARIPRQVTSACLWDNQGRILQIKDVTISAAGFPERIRSVSVDAGVIVVWGRDSESLGVGPGRQWAVYIPSLQTSKVIDLTTNDTNPGDPLYGVPDGVVNGADLSYFTQRWMEHTGG